MLRDLKMCLSISSRTVALVLSLLVIPVARSGQRTESSLTDLDIEYSELKVTLDKVVGENLQLRDALSHSEASLVEMRKTLAATNGEAEVFRRQALELKKRFEALGSSATGDTKKLEQRLLTAVNDLQQIETDKKQLTEAIIRLSEAVLRFSKTATSADAEARLTLEAEIRNANHALGVGAVDALEGIPVPSTLVDAIVISVRDEIALVVANLGQKQGVKVGMPFQVIRGDKLIGIVRVVDVREKFAGAVIQNLSSEKDRIRVGDRLKVDASP
jgi:predicted nuclease with TOPRIM domain